MTSTTVALLQISAFGTDQLKNQAKGIQYCRQAAQLGADIALFPEMWNIGYISFDRDGSRDMLLVQGGDQEGILLAEFDLEPLIKYRQQEVWGAAFRKPARYQALLSQKSNHPFIRSAARR